MGLKGSQRADKIDSVYTPVNIVPEAVHNEPITRVSAFLKGIDNALAGGEKTVWQSCHEMNNDFENYIGQNESSFATFYATFGVPMDFGSLVSFVLIGAAVADEVEAEDFYVYTNYAAIGENTTTHSGIDTTTNIGITIAWDDFGAIDLANAVSSLAAGDILGVRIYQVSSANVAWVGFRMVYNAA